MAFSAYAMFAKAESPPKDSYTGGSVQDINPEVKKGQIDQGRISDLEKPLLAQKVRKLDKKNRRLKGRKRRLEEKVQTLEEKVRQLEAQLEEYRKKFFKKNM